MAFSVSAGLDGEKSLSTRRHEWQQILHVIRFRAKDQDRHTAPGHVLLVLDIPIAREQDIPSALSKRQELAVLLGAKTRLPHRLAFMAQCGKVSLQRNRKALIDQNLHLPKRARISALA